MSKHLLTHKATGKVITFNSEEYPKFLRVFGNGGCIKASLLPGQAAVGIADYLNCNDCPLLKGCDHTCNGSSTVFTEYTLEEKEEVVLPTCREDICGNEPAYTLTSLDLEVGTCYERVDRTGNFIFSNTEFYTADFMHTVFREYVEVPSKDTTSYAYPHNRTLYAYSYGSEVIFDTSVYEAINRTNDRGIKQEFKAAPEFNIFYKGEE